MDFDQERIFLMKRHIDSSGIALCKIILGSVATGA